MSTRAERKKLGEQLIIEAFLRWRELPSSCLEDWPRERPDALLRIDGRRVGVEITSLIHARPRHTIAPQKWVAEADRAVRTAQARFESKFRLKAVVRFEFRPDWAVQRNQRGNFADELTNIVAGEIPRLIEAHPSTRPITLREPHPDVAWAYIDTPAGASTGHWAPSFVSDVQRASAEDIIATVAKKEPELTAYKAVASDVWLLIYCGVTGQGLAMEIPEPSVSAKTDFCGVFCCGFGMWQWVEISTHPE